MEDCANFPGIAVGTRPVPWMHPAAVAYLESLVGPNTTVLEQGGGGSTLWFAMRAKTVYCLEENLTWYQWLAAYVPENVIMMYGLTGLDALDYTGKIDVMLIDGKSETRITWARIASQFVRPGGCVVLDNSNKPEYADAKIMLDKLAAEVVTIHPERADQPIDTTFYFMR